MDTKIPQKDKSAQKNSDETSSPQARDGDNKNQRNKHTHRHGGTSSVHPQSTDKKIKSEPNKYPTSHPFNLLRKLYGILGNIK